MSQVVAHPKTDQSSVPVHVAVIMDGNGRWAKARGLPRTLGHKKGADVLRDTLDECRALGIQYLTVYAFSAENWKRPAVEITDLMGLLRHYLSHEIEALHRAQVRLRFIGDRTQLADDIARQITDAEQLTKQNSALHLTVALSYGARQELVAAVQEAAQRLARGEIVAADEATIASLLYTRDLPDPDLLIRTGGEQRLSNFLLWQSAYTELYFTPVLWPDFSRAHLREAVSEYTTRERRYGATGE